jgi:hypothetical protein
VAIVARLMIIVGRWTVSHFGGIATLQQVV